MTGTIAATAGLAETLFGKNRRAVLSLLYGHIDEEFYLRQIVRACGGGVGAIQRELQVLVGCGILCRKIRGKQVYFRADPACPIFSELKSLVMKTAGLADVLRTALTPLSDHIRVAFIFGSMVRNEERRESDVDVLVVGDVTFSEVVTVTRQAQESLQREVNPTVYPPKEFQAKLSAGHHFLNSVLAGDKVFLIGDEHGLEQLVQERLADQTRNEPRGNRGSVGRYGNA